MAFDYALTAFFTVCNYTCACVLLCTVSFPMTLHSAVTVTVVWWPP